MLLIQTLVCVMTLIRFIRVQIGKDLDGIEPWVLHAGTQLPEENCRNISLWNICN